MDLLSILSFFFNKFNKINNHLARMLACIYYMTGKKIQDFAINKHGIVMVSFHKATQYHMC